jgi:hypothetical protein
LILNCLKPSTDFFNNQLTHILRIASDLPAIETSKFESVFSSIGYLPLSEFWCWVSVETKVIVDLFTINI